MTEPLDAIIVVSPHQAHVLARTPKNPRVEYITPYGSKMGLRTRAVVWAVDDAVEARTWDRGGSQCTLELLKAARQTLTTRLVPGGVLVGWPE